MTFNLDPTELGMKPTYLKKERHLSKLDRYLRQWAVEAHKINPIHPVTYYYKLFLNRAHGKIIHDDILKADFFKDVIEC